jgi:hypothetical protein
LAVLALMSVLMGAVMLLQLLTQKDLYFINKFHLGLDYTEFYRASLEIRAGRSPYLVPRYVTPPFAAYANVPVSYLPLAELRYLVALSVLAMVGGSMFLMRRTFAAPDWRRDAVFLVAAAGMVSLSYPFYFLFDRGNIDGFVLLLTALGLFALRGSGWLAGVLFALAVATKVYPVLVVLPLAAHRQWKPLVALGATLLLLFVATPGDWVAFVEERLLRRGSQWRIFENGSIACTFLYLGRFTTDLLGWPRIPWAQNIASLYLPVYLVLLGLLVVRDVLQRDAGREQLCAGVALYFPFMVAMPKLAYHYELVFLLALVPVVGWFWANATRRRERAILALLVVGIALSQFQAVAAEKLLGVVHPHFVPGFGLLLVMIGVVALKWTTGAPAPARPSHAGRYSSSGIATSTTSAPSPPMRTPRPVSTSTR